MDELARSRGETIALLHRALGRLFGTLPDDALTELKTGMRFLRLDRGDELFCSGDAPDHLYILLAGRLEAFHRDASGERVVGEITPGESVGELGVLTGDPRSASVRALRRSSVATWPRVEMLRMLERFPGLGLHLCTLVARRARRPARSGVRATAGAHVVLARPPQEQRAGRQLRWMEERLLRHPEVRVLRSDSIGPSGRPLDACIRGSDEGGLEAWTDDLSAAGGWVFYLDEGHDPAWTSFCAAAADRVAVLRDAEGPNIVLPIERAYHAHLGEHRVPRHLILVHGGDTLPYGTEGWLANRVRWQHHHVREADALDRGRALRLLTDTSLGLVLGGGGARGAAHFGVLRAFTRLGIPIDRIGGVSAGGGVAAYAAMQPQLDDMVAAFRAEFVEKEPFRNVALPLFALFDEEAMDTVARNLYGRVDIPDLWIDYFCASCDISRAVKVIHRRGPLWRAVRATTAVPGVMMPVCTDEGVLVDGGLLGNVPVADMRASRAALVVAVDVSDARPLRTGFEPPSARRPARVLARRLLRGERQGGAPSILETLVRSATMAGKMNDERQRGDADLWLQPPLGDYSGASFAALYEMADTAEAWVTPLLESWKAEVRIQFLDDV